ncbi:unnamed protein product [Leptidea sinapis]|uniref:Uncharacterized protein n=2 Tax=Leptidea sinapis TaxID=189913 RepID=A0A5E4PVH7_9NEOP|nr:unnamed protein product [Leptidea sinapis]
MFYQDDIVHPTSGVQIQPTYSASDFDVSMYDELEEEEIAEEQSQWSMSSGPSADLRKLSRSKSMNRSKSVTMSASTKARKMSKSMSKGMQKSGSRLSKVFKSDLLSMDEKTASSRDDLIVHAQSRTRKPNRRLPVNNPHFDMLYCNKSETDMIKYNSNYKKKAFDVSASDEFSKKAEIVKKKIAKEFYDWWTGLGNVEFKSEIRRPEDIEDLFQVWFDEHASRSLVLDPKILPCVLQSIADYVDAPEAACPGVLKRQIAWDVHAETSPAHVLAFGTCLPQKYKHIPPRNNTKEMWHPVKIPEDLKTMACVWEEIQHLTSSKAFHEWLQTKPYLPMPPFFKALEKPGDKKQPFVVPSDFVVTDRSSSTSAQELALPISEFDLELKEVLSKLLN